jgi:phospholipase C
MLRRSGPLVLATATCALLGLTGIAGAADDKEPKPRSPIRHFISLMQQNRSFDHYFGTYPGADGIPEGTCMPVNPARPEGRCIEPFEVGDRVVRDLPQDRKTFVAQYRRGRLNGFVSAARESTGAANPSVMGYLDDSTIPYYWSAAKDYVLFDRFFTSTMSGSVRSAAFWVTGTPGNFDGQTIPEQGFGDLPTIFDRLQARGISWKFYVQDYHPAINFRNRGSGDLSSQVFWVPLLSYDRYINSRTLSSHIVDLEEYFEDLETGNLPAVSYIVAPAGGASEHEPGTVKVGQRLVAKLVNALMRSAQWKSSAFMWTYDGWGGWYDHVKPPRVDSYGYGFRAPALLVSPYAKKGHVDSTTLDSTSILKFIEQNWGLAPLASRDRRARTFTNAFDFAQAPRGPQFPSSDPQAVQKKKTKRFVIYAFYLAALIGTGLVIVWATLGWMPLQIRVNGRSPWTRWRR